MSTSRNGILAGGNWIVDAVKIIDVWPQQDTLANIFSTTKGSGGSPFNILVDMLAFHWPPRGWSGMTTMAGGFSIIAGSTASTARRSSTRRRRRPVSPTS